MTRRKDRGGGRGVEHVNDTGGAIRVRFDDEPAEPRTAFAMMKARLLRPGFLVALAVALGAAVVSSLTGYPNALIDGRPPALADVNASNVVPAAKPAAPRAARKPADTAAGEARFLDADDTGREAYRRGDYDEALARFRAAIDRNPSDAESMSNAAQILVRQGHVQDALPLLRRAVEINGNRWAYRFNLARALDQAGQFDQAVEQYEVAAALFPDDYATLFNLAQTYDRQGNETAAVDRYQRAIALRPEEPTFHAALALSLEKLGRNADASAEWTRYLELAPDGKDAAQVRARIAALQGGAASPPPNAAAASADKSIVK